MFAFHFGFTPATVSDMTVEEFTILAGWLERHESARETE